MTKEQQLTSYITGDGGVGVFLELPNEMDAPEAVQKLELALKMAKTMCANDPKLQAQTPFGLPESVKIRKKNGRLNGTKKAFIKKNFRSTSDKDLGKKLGVSLSAVYQYRQKNNLQRRKR